MSYSSPGQFAPGPQPGPPGYRFVPDPYADGLDPRMIMSPAEIEPLTEHQLTETSVGLVVFLSIITLSIYAWFHFLLMNDKLPRVKDDDPGNGKAIGFSLIPFFNLYWHFFVWMRLVRRINFQYGARGMQAPLQVGMVQALLICMLVGGFVLVPYLAVPVLGIMLIVKTQRAVNELARQR